jgi:hypothetical protein
MAIGPKSFSSQFILYFKYQVERFLIRGPFYQVLFIGFVIGLISLIGGQVLIYIEPEIGDIKTSSWWAFLRMSDPGYLGDDNGLAKRILGTALTLLGYVLFMGSLVAIMTQWLYKMMKELEAGYTPIMMKGHISILGYNNRTPIIIQQIVSSKRKFQIFLKQNRRASQKIIVLNPDVGYEQTADLSDHIGSGSQLRKVIFRTGDSMKADDLVRINVENSSVVIIPSSIYGNIGQDNSDTKAIKALLSIKNISDLNNKLPPKVVVEILDNDNVEVAKVAYPENLEIVSGRVLLSRMIAQNIQNPGLSLVIAELIAQGIGSEIHLKDFIETVGKSWGQVKRAFPGSIAIGVVSNKDKTRCLINPDDSEIILRGDLVILITNSFDSIYLDHKKIIKSPSVKEVSVLKRIVKQKRKLLVMGWSKRAPFLINELLQTQKYDFDIDVVSLLDIRDREMAISRMINTDMNERIHHIQADYTSYREMSEMEFDQYSNIVFLSSDRTIDSADADARSILGILQVKQFLDSSKKIPILIELAEPENEKLFGTKQGETIISPMVISYILANVALRFELNRVFEFLFHAGGSDITFVSTKQFGISGSMSFEEISNKVDSFKMIAIGMMAHSSGKMILNPNDKQIFSNIEKYKIIVIN